MVVVLLCIVCLLAGLLGGWFSREIRDIMLASLEIYRKLHYHQNKVARSAVISGGQVYQSGKPKADEPEDLPTWNPPEPVAPRRGGILRRPSPEDHRKSQQKAHEDEMANG